MGGLAVRPKSRVRPIPRPAHPRRRRGAPAPGVASLAPCEGSTVYGAVVELTPEEKGRLDRFEGGYREERVTVLMGGEAGREVEAIAYVAGDAQPDGGAYTPPMEERPSEKYLTAIDLMLREHWPPEHREIGLHSTLDGSCRIAKGPGWRRPPLDALGLPALTVEINALKAAPWVMPQASWAVSATLEAAGVHSPADLAAVLDAGTLVPGDEGADRAAPAALDEDSLAAARALSPRAVFAYGTLRADFLPGKGDAWGATGGCAWAPAVVEGFELWQAEGVDYPHVRHAGAADSRVTGTLVTWPDADMAAWQSKLREMDAIECYPHLYSRQPVRVQVTGEWRGGGAESAVQWAWLYYSAQPEGEGERRLEGGDWLEAGEIAEGARRPYM